MTPPGGRRRADPRPPLPRGRLAAHAAGVLATAAAWVYLVRAAIDFGGLARSGRALAWLFSGLATLGAIGCLLLAILLVTRLLVMGGLMNDYRPKRAGGRRRLP